MIEAMWELVKKIDFERDATRRRTHSPVSSRHSADSGSEVSYKSTGERKDKDNDKGSKGGGSVRSAGGDSAARGLSKKYGVCAKVAIGKGATSVVRLAHKCDRTEGDKMYAVKVGLVLLLLSLYFWKEAYLPSLPVSRILLSTRTRTCIDAMQEFRKRRKTETEKDYVKELIAEFDEAGRWCEVMEFCPGGDVYAAIKKGGVSPSEAEYCFKQISGVGESA
ncbi:hypothetical protein K438DRAFT_1972505 [Mycena galopus ATCC 62051]|nr:hypothetical protein K438DRAFT_1972505 [Mycena galopus ATCC 62051]